MTKLIVLPIDATGRYCGSGCQFLFSGYGMRCRLFGATLMHTTKSGRLKQMRPSACRKAETR